jgi:hypothetical protein
LSKGPLRHMLHLLAMVKRIPRRRRKPRMGAPQYPLSPAMRRGRIFGRPRPGRLTAPWLIKASKAVASWRCPAVKSSVMGLPWPSARRWTLVLNPPRPRPSASAAGVVFLPRLHVGGHGQWCHPRSGLPSPVPPGHLLQPAVEPVSAPRCQPSASDRSDWRLCSTFHTFQAGLSKEPLSAAPRGCR